MNKYNGLLSAVAQKYNIRRALQEAENDWKTRLIYAWSFFARGMVFPPLL